ncbi:hypothetical protein M422DRAFT_249187, partial [Sphaerobolus stellatus SS14]
MNPFGASTKCPTCDKIVYAAEQVMGPGRLMYHKLCLKCLSCSRRLDSLSLREHNREPYCNNCHVRNFGTRDLRSANVVPGSPTDSPTRRTFRSPSPPRSRSPKQDPAPDLTSTILEETEEPEANENGFPEQDSEHAISNRAAPTLATRPLSRSFPRPVSSTSTSASQSPTTNFRLTNTYTGRAQLTRSPSPTKSFSGSGSSRPLSPTMTGSSASSGIAPTYLRNTYTGASNANMVTTNMTGAGSPLRPSFTGNVPAA